MSVTTAPLTLTGVRDELLALPHPFRREDVHRVVSRLRTSPDELARFQHWSDEKYTRTRFYEGPRFEILVLCWKEGQMSPIHDHARSICSMLVLSGTAATTMYEARGGTLVPEASTALHEGQLTTVYGGDIHKVGNAQGSGQPLITIHFYLPPIAEMLVWDEGDPTPRTCKAVTLDPEPA